MKLDGITEIEFFKEKKCYINSDTKKPVDIKEKIGRPINQSDKGLYSKLDLVEKFRKFKRSNAYTIIKIEKLSNGRVKWWEIQYFVIKEV